ncbi:hypothetical protein CDD81_4845 [Ophiocordyceps australis]|uniref:Uncharacterized protein n=1 Tax=Ophiocordyceps australis TaxID=1399860 RepID=A0A2C5YBH7_9HYPO|nr:hypothetical protein CDD81_4845 [Ophiocordyceps australis]
MSLAETPSLKGDEVLGGTKDTAEGSSFGSSTPRGLDHADASLQPEDGKRSLKGKKRSLFGFGRKKLDSSMRSASGAEPPPLPQDDSNISAASRTTTFPSQSARTDTNITTATTTSANTTQSEHGPFVLPTSPHRALSNSTRVSSPAGSQIFERDVQDSTVLKPSSPAIPTHIQTENYIPPVLDDASEAITNTKLDPDAVEIVTHTSHLPASVTVTGAGMGTAPGIGSGSPFEQSSSEWAAELASFANRVGLQPDSASNLGSLDSADVRRLSFISFADVVQAEHTGHPATTGSRESIHIAGLTSIPSAAMNRSPSPIRSPVSSQGPGTSPPTSNPGSMKGVEVSPGRKPLGSPIGSQHTQHSLTAPNDLNIETMRQALRRTGSADLSTVRSVPHTPVEGTGPR